MNNAWATPAATQWPVGSAESLEKEWPTQQASPNCCEEASTQSRASYIPCNAPAINLVGWVGRTQAPIRMCAACTDHNVRNRGGEIIKCLEVQPTQQRQAANNNWPTQLPTGPVGSVGSVGSAGAASPPTAPSDPLDAMSEDDLLMLWDAKKKAIKEATDAEMELRKYIVGRAFPKKQEGINSKDLGQGYQLKAAVKYNYNLADNKVVEECLEHISDLGNEGPFIADRLVSWKPSFLLTEYRSLCDRKVEGDERAAKILSIVEKMLTITEAAPTLEIKEPRKKK